MVGGLRPARQVPQDTIGAVQHEEPDAQRRVLRGGLAIAFGAVVAALAVLWALASPVFSVPDENAHATKAIALVRGSLTGEQREGLRQRVVELPDGYRYSPQLLCFATQPAVPADCGVELGDPGGTDWFDSWVARYNPIYYYLVGWPSLLFDGSAGIYAMRLASAALSAIFAGLAMHAALGSRRSRWAPLGMAFALAPMGVYLAGSVNPNGLEIFASAALWAATLRLLETHRPGSDVLLRRRYLWGVVVASAIAVANARALGPLWVVVIVALCLLVAGWDAVRSLFTTRASWIGIGIVAAGGLFSIVWTLQGGSLSGQAEAADAPLVGGSFLTGVGYMLKTLPDHLHQAMGYFGWFDADLPVWAYWPMVAAFSVLVIVALTAVGRRSALVLLAVIASAVLVPALVQGYSLHQTGVIWQGRYALFLYLGIGIVGAWLLDRADGDRVSYIAPRVSWIGAGLVAAFGVVAFFFVFHRYVVGMDANFAAMFSSPSWQPPFGWITLFAFYAVVSVAAAVVVGLSATAASIPRLPER